MGKGFVLIAVIEIKCFIRVGGKIVVEFGGVMEGRGVENGRKMEGGRGIWVVGDESIIMVEKRVGIGSGEIEKYRVIGKGKN